MRTNSRKKDNNVSIEANEKEERKKKGEGGGVRKSKKGVVDE